ncbi:hypothetical protein BV22DRAFT_1051649 [Leucogyrophana mollusca]|uniref:Uncharacterized protein n=1 Tax=Leucogyrophana mollusca TaxID=85980 RepID=A0ACB8AZI4_9AGAM|nr:hypothetical protein BV22DRAFT_1051649 [Leucogyrophana mollusca]
MAHWSARMDSTCLEPISRWADGWYTIQAYINLGRRCPHVSSSYGSWGTDGAYVAQKLGAQMGQNLGFLDTTPVGIHRGPPDAYQPLFCGNTEFRAHSFANGTHKSRDVDSRSGGKISAPTTTEMSNSRISKPEQVALLLDTHYWKVDCLEVWNHHSQHIVKYAISEDRNLYRLNRVSEEMEKMEHSGGQSSEDYFGMDYWNILVVCLLVHMVCAPCQIWLNSNAPEDKRSSPSISELLQAFQALWS